VAVLALGSTLAQAGEQRVVSLTYRGTEVRRALSMLQTVSDLRVLIDPRVQPKRITLSLKDVPPEDALSAVVAAAGLTYRKAGNAYLVEPKGVRQAGSDRATAQAAGAYAAQPSGPGVPGYGGGIVQPTVPVPVPGSVVPKLVERSEPVPVAAEVLEALDRTVEVDVKNGPLTAVTEQLSRTARTQVSADPALSAGLVATVSLHGIPLRGALELVAGQTGLQISPRPDGVAFVQPGLSLDAAQARQRHAPASARRVEQGQLWTAEWAEVLTTGVTPAAESHPSSSLRRMPTNPDGRPLEFKPRSGRLFQTPSTALPVIGEKRQPAPAAGKSGALDTNGAQGQARSAALVCPHCGKAIHAKSVVKCQSCGRLLASNAARCPTCGGKLTRSLVMPARCPYCHKAVGSR
jgi:hypothetical protein